jgi:aspartyl-tRNA(Asn)/glutamyl-tRNA(Gln) amidotransferase subunit A
MTGVGQGEVPETTMGPVERCNRALDQARRAEAVFITLTPDLALAQAEASQDRHRSGLALGPLDGVPVAWKDLFDLAGTRTTAGSGTLIGSDVRTKDALVVAAGAAAGWVTIGKTNLSEFAFSGLGLNARFGTPVLRDRQGVRRVPGGSSSGAAAAVREGIVPIAIGTDTAGSIRVPAAFNGLVGYRSTSTRYDRAGVFPLAPTMDAIGPIAGSIRDCALVDADLGRSKAVHRPLQLPELTFVIDKALLTNPAADPTVIANLLRMADVLERAGARVTVRPIAAIATARSAIKEAGWLGAVEAYRYHRQRLSGPDRALMDPRIVRRLEEAAPIQWEREANLRRLRQELQRQLEVDLGAAILMTPTVAHTAPRLSDVEVDYESFARENLSALEGTMFGSFLDMPGLAIPSGSGDDGLATSGLFSAPAGSDDRLLSVGLSIEPVLAEQGFHQPRFATTVREDS